MLTIHHLGVSQSERILWLCEELGLPYELKLYRRDAITILSPPELVALHPLGAAPVLQDGDLLLAESAAIVEYINVKYGNSALAVPPSSPGYADYLYWLHFANGNLQPVMSRNMLVSRLKLPPDNPVLLNTLGRLEKVYALIEARLGTVDYLAGGFTAADIMSVFSLTTMRTFFPWNLSRYPNILAYLQRIGARPAYQRAMAKGDPGMAPKLT